MNYSDKLKSPKWQRKRLEVLNRDNFKCCSCGDEETELHVHHLKYTGEPYDAPLKDLQTLCKHCHEYFTFYNLEILTDLNYLESDFIKIYKLKNCFIVEFKLGTVVFNLIDNKLEYAIAFKKNSDVLSKIFEINQKKESEVRNG